MTKIKVAKFGGSLISDAKDFLKVVEVIKSGEPDLVVISATRGTTNLLEQIWLYSHQGKTEERNSLIKQFEDRHVDLACDLNVWEMIRHDFEQIVSELRHGPSDKEKYPSKDFTSRNLDRLDHILSLGEKTSSLILSKCLDDYEYLDATDYIQTDLNYSAAAVDFEKTNQKIKLLKESILQGNKFVTQGFLGRNSDGKVTTLGREGSDYSATIFAGGLGAERVSIYTDVPGVFQADPKKWSFCKAIKNLSYSQAETMAEKGAKVLFPKTLLPIKEQKIPLEVTNLSRDSVTTISMDAELQPAFVFQDEEMALYSPSTELNVNKISKEVFGDLCSGCHTEEEGWYRISFTQTPDTSFIEKFFSRIV